MPDFFHNRLGSSSVLWPLPYGGYIFKSITKSLTGRSSISDRLTARRARHTAAQALHWRLLVTADYGEGQRLRPLRH